jgi:hypothetical protein
MSDSDDIQDALIDNLKTGISEKQIGDRRYRFHSPQEIYDVAKRIAADEQTEDGPFLKVRFRNE